MSASYDQDDAVRRYGRNNVDDCQSKATPGLYRVWCKPGVRYRKASLPHSEVCMHMRIAGKPMDFELIETMYAPMVQLYKPDTDEKFSAPITYGEGGVYYAGDVQRYYFYPNFPPKDTI